MSIVNTLTFESNKQINFDGGDLSSDADFLLIKAFVNKRLLNYLFHICHNFAKFFPADDLYNIHTTFIQPGQNTSSECPAFRILFFPGKSHGTYSNHTFSQSCRKKQTHMTKTAVAVRDGNDRFHVFWQDHRTAACHGPPLIIAVVFGRKTSKSRMLRIHQDSHTSRLHRKSSHRPEICSKLPFD